MKTFSLPKHRRKKIKANEAEVQIITMDGGAVEVQAGEGDGKKGPRKFSVIAYNGGPLHLDNFKYPIVVDLKGLTLAKSIVANLHHDKQKLVGHATEVKNTGKQLIMAGVVSGTGTAAQEFLGNHDNGFPWQASIENLPEKLLEVKAGQTVNVNDQTFTGPIYVATKSRLRGVAFLPRGADENTSVSVAAGAAEYQKGTTMDPEFKAWIEACELDPSTLKPNQIAHLRKKYDLEIKAAEKTRKETGTPPEPPKPDLDFNLDEIKATAEGCLADLEVKLTTYETEIKAARGGEKKFAEIKAGAYKEARELKAKAIAERWSSTKLEVEAIRAASKIELKLVEAKAPQGPQVFSSSREVNGEVIEAAMALTLNIDKPEEHYKEEVLEAARKEFKDGMTLQQITIMAAESNGYNKRTYSITQSNLPELLEYAFPSRRDRRRMIEAGGFTTISLPILFQNLANKELLQGYDAEDLQDWRIISAEKSVPDFKQITSYRMLDDMKYEQLAPDGHIKHLTLGEETYTRQAKTWAKMGQFTRTDFINNDLGTFDDLRTRLGRGAMEALNELVWKTFLNNSNFFTAARGNYIVGAGTALDLTGTALQTATTAFSNMRVPGPNGPGRRKGGRATFMLVPPELQFIADTLFGINNAGTQTLANTNIWVNKYRPITVPWLSDSAYTGYSTTAYYLFRTLGELAPIVVSYLNNVRQPTVETADADFDQLGVQLRGYHDFGVDFAEYLAGLKVKGAA